MIRQVNFLNLTGIWKLCILQIVEIDYGMKDKNPMEKVLFYRKNSPDKAYPLMKQDIPVSMWVRSRTAAVLLPGFAINW